MAMPGKKAPKSRKSDGTPKKRWSAAERAARGAKPRKGGGQRPYEGSRPRFEKRQQDDVTDRGSRTDSGRDDRRFDDRRSRDNREPGAGDRRSFDRDAGTASRGRFDGQRSSDRDNRGRHGERPRFESGGRDDRPRYGDRDASRGFGGRGRDERPRHDDRPRFESRGRDDRSRYGDRDASRGFEGRGRDDRPRSESRGRDDRSRYGDRDASRGFEGRGRDERSGSDRRSDDRGPRRYEDRGARSFDRGDRGFGGPNRRGPSNDFRDRSHQPRRDSRPGRGDRPEHASSDFGAPESDQMSWSAHDAVDVEVSETHQASGFAELGVGLPLVAQLSTRGITEPFPIQQATIMDGIAGRDVLGRGRTGSGKTLAFGLAMLTRLADGRPTGSPRAMILTPTRELALQIADDLSPLAGTVGLGLTLITGGMSYTPQIRAFERGVDIVVATPGRLIDLMEQGAADLSQVEITVLDEADHMSDLGFMPAVTTLLDAVPDDGQRMLFSATLDGAVDRLVRKFLHDPVTHEVDSSKNAVTTLTHHMLQLAPHHKNPITAEIANRDGKTVIFARTQMGVERIAGQLRETGVMAGGLHGGLTQGARARVLAAFKGEDLPVLVATDVAARGIHVDDVSLVLQVDPPMNSKDYLHRAGRTARAGESGAVVSLVLPHQRKEMRRISGQAGVKVAPQEVTPGSVDLREATGARLTSGTPIPESEYQRLIAPKQQPRRNQARGGGGGFRKRQGGGGRHRNWK